VHSILRHTATFFPAFRRLSAHATITRLKSGSWRVQVRRKGKYVNETFLRRKDAEEWGIDIERRIDRQEPTTTRQSRDVQLFGDLVTLHRQDLEEVGKDIGRSKAASLTFLDERLGIFAFQSLIESASSSSEKSARWMELVLLRSASISDISKRSSLMQPQCTASLCQPNQSTSPGSLFDVSGSSERAMSVIDAHAGRARSYCLNIGSKRAATDSGWSYHPICGRNGNAAGRNCAS
jgi:hypothetical protein